MPRKIKWLQRGDKGWRSFRIKPMHAGKLFEEGFSIVKIRWWQCIRRGVIRSYKVSSEDIFISAKFIVRTDGPVRMAKPSAAEKRRRLKGEYGVC